MIRLVVHFTTYVPNLLHESVEKQETIISWHHWAHTHTHTRKFTFQSSPYNSDDGVWCLVHGPNRTGILLPTHKSKCTDTSGSMLEITALHPVLTDSLWCLCCVWACACVYAYAHSQINISMSPQSFENKISSCSAGSSCAKRRSWWAVPVQSITLNSSEMTLSRSDWWITVQTSLPSSKISIQQLLCETSISLSCWRIQLAHRQLHSGFIHSYVFGFDFSK